jgi:flavin reductase (DIM6/NTAB) family NADH-FMN oxidoreductase RutF
MSAEPVAPLPGPPGPNDRAGTREAITPIDSLAFRAALGRFATGVAIITCVDATGMPIGLTANSFNALSLTPPLVLWSLRQQSPSLAAFQRASHFAINILSEAQVELSRRFASPVADKFSEGLWSPGAGQAPVLTGAAAVIECSRHAEHLAGDHVLFIGEVCRVTDLAGAPLVFHGGRYHLLGEIL